MSQNIVYSVITLIVYIGLVSITDGKYTGTMKQLKVCDIKHTEEDCIMHIQAQVLQGPDGMMRIGGWQAENLEGMDSYMSDILSDVRNILKDCGLRTKANVLGVYKQVVAGLNVCISVKVSHNSCSESAALPCKKPQTTNCSILAYKPPSKEPVLSSDVSVYCDL